MTRAVISPASTAALSPAPGDSARTQGSTHAVEAKRRARRLRVTGLRRLAAEPFVQFTLLGALVFAAHRLLAPAIEPPAIEVSATKQRELDKLFEQRQRRAPTDSERQQSIQRYVEDEALFREGLRLSLIETDPTLRAQMVARVRGMLQAELDQTPPSEAELRAFYEAHHADYVRPETIGYREYVIASGPDANDDARRLLALLKGEGTGAEGLPSPSEYGGYSEAQLVPIYGAEFTRALWALPNGSWRELRSSRGVHLVRIDERNVAFEPPFAALRDRVSADYRKDRTARAFQARVSQLTSAWRVHIAEPP